MKKKFKIVLISLVALAVLAVACVFFFVFGKKLTIVPPHSSSYSVGAVVQMEAKTGFLLKEEKTEWYVNGWLCGTGRTVKVPLDVGENIIIASNGKQEKQWILLGNLYDNGEVPLKEHLFLPDGFSQGEQLLLYESTDYDLDGLSNRDEKQYKTNPYLPDTDGDGLLDGAEIALGTDPLTPDPKEARAYTVNGEHGVITIRGCGNIPNSWIKEYDANALGFDRNMVLSKVLQPVRNLGVGMENSGERTLDEDYSLTISFPTEAVRYDADVSVFEFNASDNAIKELQTINSSGYFSAETRYGMYCFLAASGTELKDKMKNQIIFCIDQSPSMYSPIFLQNTDDFDENSNFSGCNQDPDFKRLDLVADVVNALGTDAIEYRVDVFWGDRTTICDWTSDCSTILKALEDERNAYHGTSTALYEAIREAMRSFDENCWGVKQVILLTDGQDSGLLSLPIYEFMARDYYAEGKRISAIALGDNADKECLQNYADWTGGQFLFAPDADALMSLITPLQTMMSGQKNVGVQKDGYELIACSGFSSAIDGFSFCNFGSAESEGGNCHGMSQLAKALYLGVKIPDGISSSANKAKPMIFSNLVHITVPEIHVTESNRTRLKKGVTASLGIEIPTPENNPNGWYFGENDKLLTAFPVESAAMVQNFDDLQVLQMISRYQLMQKKDSYDISVFFEGLFSPVPGLSVSEMEQLIDEVKGGSPALIGLHCSYGGHAVLVTDVWKALDSEEYYLSLYDSNHPLESPAIYVSLLHNTTESGHNLSRYNIKYFFDTDSNGEDIYFNCAGYSGMTDFDYNE